MNKIGIFCVLFFAISSFNFIAGLSPPVFGGVSPVTDEETKKTIRDHTHKAFEVVKKGENNQECNIVDHDEYTKQVVAGSKYGALVKYNCGKDEHTCHFKVWEQISGDSKYFWECPHLEKYSDTITV